MSRQKKVVDFPTKSMIQEANKEIPLSTVEAVALRALQAQERAVQAHLQEQLEPIRRDYNSLLEEIAKRLGTNPADLFSKYDLKDGVLVPKLQVPNAPSSPPENS